MLEHVLVALRREPGLGHYVGWGAVLILTTVFVVSWFARMWRNAPDPDERWRRSSDESASVGARKDSRPAPDEDPS